MIFTNSLSASWLVRELTSPRWLTVSWSVGELSSKQHWYIRGRYDNIDTFRYNTTTTIIRIHVPTCCFSIRLSALSCLMSWSMLDLSSQSACLRLASSCRIASYSERVMTTKRDWFPPSSPPAVHADDDSVAGWGIWRPWEKSTQGGDGWSYDNRLPLSVVWRLISPAGSTQSDPCCCWRRTSASAILLACSSPFCKSCWYIFSH